MTICIPQEVQQWLHMTRIVVTVVDPALDQTAQAMVFGRVGSRYDVTGWLTAATTPILIRQVMSMYIAAWEYKKTYSESMVVDSTNYGQRLENQAKALLEQIMAHEVLLIDDDTEALSTGSIAFFPTDVQEFDELGNETKFTMGAVF
jgi:hypothetical protein